MSFACERLERRPSGVSARNILIWNDLQEMGRHCRPGKQCGFSSKDTGTLGDFVARELCDLIVRKDYFGSCVESKQIHQELL